MNAKNEKFLIDEIAYNRAGGILKRIDIFYNQKLPRKKHFYDLGEFMQKSIFSTMLRQFKSDISNYILTYSLRRALKAFGEAIINNIRWCELDFTKWYYLDKWGEIVETDRRGVSSRRAVTDLFEDFKGGK